MADLEGAGAAVGATKPKTPRERLDEVLDGSMLNDSANLDELENDPPQKVDAQAQLEANITRQRELEWKMAQAEKALRRQQRLDQLLADQDAKRKAEERTQAGVSLTGTCDSGSHQGDRARPGKSPGAYEAKTLVGSKLPQRQRSSSEKRSTPRSRDEMTSSPDDRPRPRSRRAASPKMPHMPLPRFRKGDNWDDFLVEFYNMADLVGLDAYQLLPYLKSCLPEDGCRHLVKNRVKTLGEAIVELDELYTPTRDSTSILTDLEHIRQQPGEKFCTLASRIRSIVNEALPYLSSHITEEEKESLIGTKFCHAISNDAVKSQMLWARRQRYMTTKEMVRSAQDFQSDLSRSGKGALRVTDESAKVKQLEAQLEEMRRTLQDVVTGKTRIGDPKLQEACKVEYKKTHSSQSRQPRRKLLCWNCGDEGHRRTDCPKETIGDGFTHRPPPSGGRPRHQRRQRRKSPSDEDDDTKSLNY